MSPVLSQRVLCLIRNASGANLTMTLIDIQSIEGSTTKIDCKNIN